MDPLDTKEEVAGGNGGRGGAARGTPANPSHGGPIKTWRKHQEFTGKLREGGERSDRALVVVSHGEHSSDSGGNGDSRRR